MCDVSDAQDDVQSDMVWATYGEIAEAKGISKRSVARMAQRHRLRRQPGNDGKVRVLISRDMLAPPHGASQRTDESDEQSGTLQAVRTAYDTALAARTKRLPPGTPRSPNYAPASIRRVPSSPRRGWRSRRSRCSFAIACGI
jgi:hypothetical protein